MVYFKSCDSLHNSNILICVLRAWQNQNELDNELSNIYYNLLVNHKIEMKKYYKYSQRNQLQIKEDYDILVNKGKNPATINGKYLKNLKEDLKKEILALVISQMRKLEMRQDDPNIPGRGREPVLYRKAESKFLDVNNWKIGKNICLNRFISSSRKEGKLTFLKHFSRDVLITIKNSKKVPCGVYLPPKVEKTKMGAFSQGFSQGI